MGLDVQLQNGMVLAFPSPILCVNVPQAATINTGLKKAVLARAKKTGGAAKHNVGGWRSEADLMSWPMAELDLIKQALNKAIARLTQLTLGPQGKAVSGEISAVAWANLCRTGDYIKPHIHPLSTWGAVYYVSAGTAAKGSPDSGVLEFIDPRMGVDILSTPGDPFGRSYKVRPAPGLLVIHPGWLVHFTNPYLGRAERISLGFNVFIKGVTLAKDGAAGKTGAG